MFGWQEWVFWSVIVGYALAVILKAVLADA